MAMNMDALLRIKAAVTGGEQVTALGKKFNQVQGAAAGLTKGAGLLGPALGALAPVATVGGITAMVGKTIEAGNAIYDLSQRTGVSVEALARFKKAAVGTGTDLDSVAKSLGKLSKGLYEAATTGKGTTAEALKTLGISAKDAAGNLKTADQVTLEIADRFKAMPDGVQKTAIAMQLFGRSGAEMIPILNKGGETIDKLSVKMTTAFAEKADQYTTKLQALSGKVGGLAADLTIALLPAMEAVANAVTAGVDAFNALPGPIKGAIGVLAGLAVAVTALLPLLASLSVVLTSLAGAGIKTAFLASFSGALTWIGTVFVPGMLTLLSGVLTWIGTVFVPAMLAFFSGPVGWITLAVIAVGAMVYAFREPIGKFFVWLGERIGEMLGSLRKWFTDFLSWVGEGIKGAAKIISDGITGAISGAWKWLTERMAQIGSVLAKPFSVAVDGIKAAMRGLLQFLANRVNIVASLVNNIIRAYNRLPAPDLPEIPMVQVPTFAGGGYTGSGPRVGGIDGRGGFPAILHPQETVIDHTRGGAAAQIIGGGGSSGAAPSITIQTGPVYRLPDGTDTVSVADLQAAMQATAAAIMGQVRRPAGRLALGLS